MKVPVIFRVKHFKSLLDVIVVLVIRTFLVHQSNKLLQK